MHTFIILFLRQRGPGFQLLAATGNGQLGVDIAPLAHAQIGEELALAELGQLVVAQCLALFLVVAPQVESGHEVGTRVAKTRVGLVGLLLFFGRALPRVLDRQGAGDHQHLLQAAQFTGCEHHPRQPRVHREPGHAPAHPGKLPGGRDCAQFLK